MSGRILVMRGGALGDFILGLPALNALRNAFPAAQLTLIAPRAVLPLAAGLADSTVPLEAAENAAFFSDELPASEVAERYAGLDLAVVWMADPDGGLRRQFERLGVRRIVQAPALPPGDAVMHATDYLLGTLAGSAGILPAPGVGTPDPPGVGAGRRAGPRADTPVRPYVAPDPVALSRARDLLANLGFLPGERVVAIHAGSGGRWKCWPAERFARLIEALALSGRRSLLIAGPADEEVTAAVLAELRDPPPVVSGLPVDSLAALLSLCGDYAGNDSGVTHLAAAVGLPVVALFGPTDPAVWGPRGDRVTILRGEGGRLESVAVESVVEALIGLTER